MAMKLPYDQAASHLLCLHVFFWCQVLDPILSIFLAEPLSDWSREAARTTLTLPHASDAKQPVVVGGQPEGGAAHVLAQHKVKHVVTGTVHSTVFVRAWAAGPRALLSSCYKLVTFRVIGRPHSAFAAWG